MMSANGNKNPQPELFPGATEVIAKPGKPRSVKPVADEHLPPNLGKPVKVAVPNFSNPKRPKTCLEVDFPIVPINALSALEGNAAKPIYQMSKWWARRRSCIFRAMLIAAAMEAPARKGSDGKSLLDENGVPLPDETEASRAVWNVYYANHQKAGNFSNLKVLDCFMGGGTTLVEGSRLGFQLAGVDLNPVAWFIVKNELACTDAVEVKTFFDGIEAEVKPQIQPFYITDGLRGHKGKWFCKSEPGARSTGHGGTGASPRDEGMPLGFDPCTLPPEERKKYRYEGPEIIYTFWAKHGPCIRPECNHRTPIFRSPVVATKKLGVKYIECTCKNRACGTTFHAELGDARIAPDAEHVILSNELPYSVISGPFARALLEYEKGGRDELNARIAFLSEQLASEPGLNCPVCGQFAGQYVRDILAKHRDSKTYGAIKKKDYRILPSGQSKKPVFCTLLIDPEWLKGTPGVGTVGLGGFADAPVDATAAWYHDRLNNLRLIEVRGQASRDAKNDADQMQDGAEEPGLPPRITLRDGRILDTRAETIARKANGKEWDSHFVCAGCGTAQDLRLSVQATRRTAPVAPYVIQAYDRDRDVSDAPYGGRYFKAVDTRDVDRMIAADREWTARRDADLNGCWPREEIPVTYMTHKANFALPEQGYTHWYKMFNPRQLLVHAGLLKAIVTRETTEAVRFQALGAVQQYLRNQNGFAIWNLGADKLEPFFSNSNYAAKDRYVENSVFGAMGRGNWLSCVEGVVEGVAWGSHPWEVTPPEMRKACNENRVLMPDPVLPGAQLHCGSSSELPFDGPFDLVITDPPFGDNIFYSDLSNFFYAWLRLPLKSRYASLFSPTKTPSAQEALKPRALPDNDGDKHYYDRLTPCWTEACRVMRDGGLLAFTFHHSEDSQWEIVLRSLFEAGFYLEASYPVASDEMKGVGGQFGAKGTEYDIIHTCRKRLESPKAVSWPKMRRWVKSELIRLRPLLESFKTRGLSEADIRVMLRGKALEFYSRHYGKVLVSAPGGEEEALSIRDALLGINQLLDEDNTDAGERPPSIVQPVVYQYLRLFGAKMVYSRDEVSKLLRGTAIQQKDFERTGSSPWITETDKAISRVMIHDRFQKMRLRSRRELKTELDQAHFLIGAAMPVAEGGTGVNIEKELERDTFLIRPGVEAILDWYSRTPPGADEPDVPRASGLALTLLRAAFEAHRARMRQEDPMLFDEWDSTREVES